jgi:hypothetical protein
MSDFPNCPRCGTPMEVVAEYPDWLIHHGSYGSGTPIHHELQVLSYSRNPAAADLAHQNRLSPYRRRLSRMEWSDTMRRIRRAGLLARPKVQW